MRDRIAFGETALFAERNVTAWLAGLVVLTLAVHLALLPAGGWTTDEFYLFAPNADSWQQRVFGWSPRPFSEALLAVYGALVLRLHTPLVVPALAVSWVFVVLPALSAGWLCRGPQVAGPRQRQTSALEGGLLLSAVLLMVRPGEAFYWPAASVAYLPTLGAMIFASLAAAIAGGWTNLAKLPLAARMALLAWLLIAATSSEIGAAYAAILGAGSLLGGRAGARNAWISAAPAIVGIAVLLAFNRYRGQGTDVMAPASPTLGHPVASLEAALPFYLREFGDGPWRGGWAGVAGCLILRAVLFQCFRPASEERPARLKLADLVPCAALLAAGFTSLLSAYLKFGMPCCERHETLRQAMFTLALFSLAAVLPVARPGGRRDLRRPALAAALTILLMIRLPGAVHDLKTIPAIVAGRATLWGSARDPGSELTYILTPDAKIAGGGWRPPPGRYDGSAGGGRYGSERVMDFFARHSLVVR